MKTLTKINLSAIAYEVHQHLVAQKTEFLKKEKIKQLELLRSSENFIRLEQIIAEANSITESIQSFKVLAGNCNNPAYKINELNYIQLPEINLPNTNMIEAKATILFETGTTEINAIISSLTKIYFVSLGIEIN